jgi:hypothetical protein
MSGLIASCLVTGVCHSSSLSYGVECSVTLPQRRKRLLRGACREKGEVRVGKGVWQSGAAVWSNHHPGNGSPRLST